MDEFPDPEDEFEFMHSVELEMMKEIEGIFLICKVKALSKHLKFCRCSWVDSTPECC